MEGRRMPARKIFFAALFICAVIPAASSRAAAAAGSGAEGGAKTPAVGAEGGAKAARAAADAAAKPLSFTDVTDTCGLGGTGGDRFSFGDFDGDGDPDLLVNASRLFRNDTKDGTIRFTEVTAAAGIRGAGGGGACWFDFDRDGRLDFVTNSGQVWINDGKGAFRDIKKSLGIEVPNGAAAAIGCGDLNGDGWIDILTGGGEIWKPYRLFPQTMWLNVKGKKLAGVTKKAGLGLERYGRAVVWCDYDWDGDEDVYSGNYRLQPNSLFRNDKGRLEDVAAAAGVTGRFDQTMFTDPHTGKKCGFSYGHTIAASWADLNDDGLFDIWVSNLAHRAIGKVSASFAKVLGSDYDSRGYYCDDSNIFINLGPPKWKFEDRRAAMGIPPIPIKKYGFWRGDELWSNAACGDADNNGWIDVYVNQVYGNQPNSYALLFMNEGGSFAERHKELPLSLWGGYGSAWADIDSDGRLDLVAGGAPKCNGKASLHVFHNETEGGGWIGFSFPPSKTDQRVGTKVLLVQERRVQVRQVETTMGSHTQQNDMRLHFGLGEGGKILDVVVYRPGGRILSLGTPAPGTYHIVKPKKVRAVRLGRVGPRRVKAGTEAGFKTTCSAAGARFYWSFGPTRRVDAVTASPAARHLFAEKGRHPGLVRAVGRDGGCAERTFTVIVE